MKRNCSKRISIRHKERVKKCVLMYTYEANKYRITESKTWKNVGRVYIFPLQCVLVNR